MILCLQQVRQSRLVQQTTHTILTYSSSFHNETQTQDPQPNTFTLLLNQGEQNAAATRQGDAGF